jgi:hypothetical protein
MAAGLGFKTFTTGEVLTAADTNGYLMQGVLVFASAAARDAAITSPQEGQCCYLKDTDAVQTYSGSAWVGFDDSNAIQNSIVDAKGDIVAASGNDTPARLAVGNNGDTLVADSSATTGLRYQGNYAAGKNKVINGDMNIWQRGTSFSVGNAGPYYGAADRWRYYHNGGTAGTNTISRQTFPVGQTDVAGNPTYFQRWTATTIGTSQSVADFDQLIEDVSTLAGQTVTASIFIKSSGTFTFNVYLEQNFGSGGSSAVGTTVFTGSTSTSWTRVTGTVTLPSISGKTVGTGSSLRFLIRISSPTNGSTFDIANAQVEAGNTTTVFQTATGTLQGELAACQRYFTLWATGSAQPIGMGTYLNGTQVNGTVPLLVEMRTTPTISQVTGTGYYRASSAGGGSDDMNSLTLDTCSTRAVRYYNASEAAGTAGQAAVITTNNASSFLAFQAEL